MCRVDGRRDPSCAVGSAEGRGAHSRGRGDADGCSYAESLLVKTAASSQAPPWLAHSLGC